MDYINLRKEKNALYLNFPFCKTPCSYCHYIDNLNFGYSEIPDEYVTLIIRQLESNLNYLDGILLESIYFGGGTPSLLSDEQINRIKKVFEKHNIMSKEISIEIHPTMCNFNYIKNSFFTRYSIGVQSFDKDTMNFYNRKGYTIESIVKMIENIRREDFYKVINIDLIFDTLLLDIDFECINFIQPETITLYPNTKGRGIQRLEKIKDTLNIAKSKLLEYKPLGKSSFIFVRKGCNASFYSKNEYELNGNIIGIGHNSISYIGDKTYLCTYNNSNILLQERINRGSRYLNSLAMGLPVGVLKSQVHNYMPEIIDMHFLRSLKSECDISNKHCKLCDCELVYLPEDEYIRFYNYILSNYDEQLAKIFLATIGFGDTNYDVIEYYYNKKIKLSKNEILMLKSKLIDSSMILKKLKIPKMNILVEGIDGSGKDTFVDLFVQELKKRFFYDTTSSISVMGQPDSRLDNGNEAKKFIENIEYNGGIEHVQNILTKNRLASEKKIETNNGITILIRGLVTDKATFSYVFNIEKELGENRIIHKWDKYIVISVSPEVADKRIEDRGIPRTWRENINHLKYFQNYYKEYTNSIFNEKIIIENTDLNSLKLIAKEMADDIYANQLNKR